jgi:hypothetical protein
MGLREESCDFPDEIILGSIELAPISDLQIAFGDSDVVCGRANRSGLSFR